LLKAAAFVQEVRAAQGDQLAGLVTDRISGRRVSMVADGVPDDRRYREDGGAPERERASVYGVSRVHYLSFDTSRGHP